MVPLTAVNSGFHGRVIAARLGADGILTQLRGAADGPYPVGAVEVLVPEDDLDDARALLEADAAAQAAWSEPSGPDRVRSTMPLVYWAAAVLILAAVIGLLGHA